MSENKIKNNGLKLYALSSNFENDETKNCGLTGVEIDANFLFLRNNDIYEGVINDEDNTLILKKGDNETIIIPNIRKGTIITGGYFDEINQNIVFKTNENDIVITGITLSTIFSSQEINGDGSVNSPLRINELYKTPFLLPAKTIIDLTTETKIDDKYKTKNSVIITKEIENFSGFLYNFDGIKDIESKLKAENSSWHIPSNEEWGEMLNAIEPCDNMNHHKNINDNLGKLAGAYLKSDGANWISETPTSFSYGFKAMPCGFKMNKLDSNSKYGYYTRFWSNTTNLYGEVWVRQLEYDKSTVKLTAGDKEGFYSLRLIRKITQDIDSHDIILGKKYPIIKMPYVKLDENGKIIESGYNLWTSINISYEVDENNYDIVKNINPEITHYLNYWNGKYWEKRKILENYIVTIEDRDNKEYKFVNNEFVLLTPPNTDIETLKPGSGINIDNTNHLHPEISVKISDSPENALSIVNDSLYVKNLESRLDNLESILSSITENIITTKNIGKYAVTSISYSNNINNNENNDDIIISGDTGNVKISLNNITNTNFDK